MNKKLKFIIAGVAVVAGLASAVSCQDLSKDVDALSKKVSALETTVNDLQSKINAGAVITGVATTSEGVTVTLSDGKTFNISNGSAGAPGKDAVVTIGANGNWFINGEDTGKTSVGQKGADGDSIVWKLSSDGKYFEEYKNGVKTGEKVAITVEGGLTAVWDAEKGVLTLYGAQNAGEAGIPIVITSNAAAAAAVSLVDAYSGFVLYPNETWGYPQGYDILEHWHPGNYSFQQTNYYGYNYAGVKASFTNVIEKANVFEEGIKNAITFEEGRQTPVGDAFIVRVSPANYEPKAEDFSFVNSLGIVYNNIKVKAVVPYMGLLTKSYSLGNTGLWAIAVVLEDYDEEEFDLLTNADGDAIAYAIKVGEAVSTYDITFSYYDFVPSDELEFLVGETYETAIDIEALNNRYPGEYPATGADRNPSLQKGGTTTYEELTWLEEPAVAPILKGDDKNVQTDLEDNRGTLPVYKAVLGEAINVYTNDDNIAAMYITFDYEENAIESAPSEWNAWKSYEAQIEGLNEVQEAPVATITINAPTADGDVIGFRVFAVNLDGTLVDPDGRAFYVQVGEPGTQLAAINTVMNTIELFKAYKSADVAVDYSKNKISAAAWDFVMDSPIEDAQAVSGMFFLQDKDGNDIVVADGPFDYEEDVNIDLSKIAKAYFTPFWALYWWEDGVTYEGEFTFYNEEGFVVATIPVSFTKTLPTSIAQVPVKTSQLGEDGVYRCFLVPAIWTAYDSVEDAEADGQLGTIDMLSIFNFPDDDPKGYEITFANAAYGANNKLVKQVVRPIYTLDEDPDLNKAENLLTIDALDLIDNTTKHTTSVVYNMGYVSSELMVIDEYNNVDWEKSAEYTLDAGSFPTIFFCIYNDDAKYGWPWAYNWTKAQFKTLFGSDTEWKNSSSAPAITYEDFDGKTLTPTYIAGQSKWDSIYKGTMPTGYKNSIKVQKVQLLTKGGSNDGKEEYYTVDTAFKFSKKSGATNPTAPVASNLVINFTDMYGHENVVKLDAKVMPR